MAVIAHKLDLIANELEQELSESQPQDIFDQTIYSVCEVLFQINNSDLTGMCVPLKTLAELHPDLASNLSLSIANAGLLHVMKHGEDPVVLLRKFKEEFGDNFLIAAILRKYRYCREKSEYMDPYVHTLTQALLKNVTQCVRSILSPGRQRGSSSVVRPPPVNVYSSFVDVAPPLSNEDVVPPLGNEDVAPPLGNKDVAPPLGNNDVAPPISNKDVVPPLGNKDVAPPLSNEDVVPPLGNKDVAPPLSNNDVAPPLSDESLTLPPSNEHVATDYSSDEEMETTSLLEGNSCEMFESLRTSDSKANCRVVNIDGDHTSLRRHRMRLDESDIKERQSTEVRKDDGREGLESESDIEEGGSEEEGNSEGVEIMEEEGSGREGGERGIGDKEASGSMNSTMLSLNGRLENYMPPKRNLQISPESEVSNVESNDSFGKFDLALVPSPYSKRRKPRRTLWSSAFTQKLIDGVNTLGVGNWAEVLKLKQFPSEFNNNTLRYKWKNLVKYDHVVLVQRKWKWKY